MERTSGRGKGLGAFGWLLRAERREGEEEEEDWCIAEKVESRRRMMSGAKEFKRREGQGIRKRGGEGREERETYLSRGRYSRHAFSGSCRGDEDGEVLYVCGVHV